MGVTKHVALPDAHVRRVAALPGRRLGIVAVVLGLPLGRRDAPDRLAGQGRCPSGSPKRVLREVVLHGRSAPRSRGCPRTACRCRRTPRRTSSRCPRESRARRGRCGSSTFCLAGAPAVPRAAAGPRPLRVGEPVGERREARERLVGGGGGVRPRWRGSAWGVRLVGLVQVPRLLRDAPSNVSRRRTWGSSPWPRCRRRHVHDHHGARQPVPVPMVPSSGAMSSASARSQTYCTGP